MPSRRADDTDSRTRLATAARVIALLFAIGLVLYAAQGPRGTDQYWYVADAETLAAGNAPLSNTWFPMGLLRAEADAEHYRAPFYHNGPLLHLVAVLDRALPLSAYAIWIGINLLCLLLTVGVTHRWLRRRTNAELAGWMAAFAAVSPIGIWQAANVLRETWFGALGALAIALFFLVRRRRHRFWTEIALAAVLGLGALAHPMFLILLALLGLVRALEWLSERRASRFALILPAVAAITVVVRFKDAWFPSSFQPDLESIIVSAVPGVTNMAWHFADVQATLDGSFLLAKLRAAAEKQFADPLLAPIYLQTNAAVLAWALLVVAAVRHRRDVQRRGGAPGRVPSLFTLLVLGTFLGLYAAMIVLQQNHMRFQQLVAPAAFVLIGHALHVYLPRHWLPILMLPLVLGFAAVSTVMAKRLHDEALGERRDRAVLEEAFDFVAADARVLFVDVTLHDPMSFVLRPTPALFIRSALIDDDVAAEAIARFAPDVLVTAGNDVPYGLEGFEARDAFDTPSFGPLVVRARAGE